MTPFVALYDPLKAKNKEITFLKFLYFLPHFHNKNFSILFFARLYLEPLKCHLNLDDLPNDVMVVFVEVLELDSTSH